MVTKDDDMVKFIIPLNDMVDVDDDDVVMSDYMAN